MNIIYVVGPRIGSSLQAARIIPHLNNYQVKIAGYIKYSSFQNHLDYCLDALDFKYDNYVRDINATFITGEKVIKADSCNLYQLIQSIKEFKPDLIINDCEEYFVELAESLKIEWWLVSPVLLLDSLHKFYYKNRYRLATHKTRKFFIESKPAKKLVYSAFGDLAGNPNLKDGFQWIRPYYKALPAQNSVDEKIACTLNNFRPNLQKVLPELNYIQPNDTNKLQVLSNNKVHLSLGQSDILADLIYAKKQLLISPSIDDVEGIVNSNLIDTFKIGRSLGQIEFMNEFAKKEIELKSKDLPSYDLDVKDDIKYLDQLL